MKLFRKIYRTLPLILALYNGYQAWFYYNLSLTLVYLTLILVVVVGLTDPIIKRKQLTGIKIK